MSRHPGLLIPFLVLFLAGCQNVTKLDLTHLSRGTHQRPEDVVSALEIEPGQRVADLGAGHGYFVPYLADAVGPNGRVYAVEVDANKITLLAEKYGDRDNVETVLADYDDPRLPDGRLDLVLIVNTFHHVENRQEYFTRLQADLAPGGRVAILEPDAELGGVLSLFLDEGHTSSAADVRTEMVHAGYAPVESFDFLPVQIFELFEHPELDDHTAVPGP